MLTKYSGLSRIGRLAHTLADALIAASVLIFALHAANAWFDIRTEKIRQMDAIASLMKRTLDTYLVSKQAGLQSLVDALDDAGGLRDLPRVQRLLSEPPIFRVAAPPLVLMPDAVCSLMTLRFASACIRAAFRRSEISLGRFCVESVKREEAK